MKRILILLWLLIFLGTLIPAEKVSIEEHLYWVKTYGGSDFDVANAVAVAPNGDVIVAGATGSFGAGKGDVWVLRLDEKGNIKWQKTCGGSDGDGAHAVAVAPNGDIIVAGLTWSFGTGKTDAWILRLDENGNVKWQKTYGGSFIDVTSAVAIAPNGDIIVAGYTESFGAGENDFWVLRLDENGNVKWQKTYGGSSYDDATTVAVSEDNDVIVAGSTASFGGGAQDLWILRLDENGNLKWQKTYGGGDFEVANAVVVADNGDIIVAGMAGFGAGKGDVWVLRLDAEGNLKWQKTYGGSYLDGANTVILTENGDIIVAGATASFGTGTPDYPNAWVLRLDENGNVKWQKAYGGSDLDVATAIALALNSDIIVAGITNSSGTGKDDFWVLRFPPDGLIPGFSMDSEAIIWNLAIQKSNSNATISDSEARVMDSNAIVLNSKAIITKVIELETLKTTTTTTTTETTTSTATTTTSQEQATETTEEENSDICGPATFLVFVLIGGVVTRIKGEKC